MSLELTLRPDEEAGELVATDGDVRPDKFGEAEAKREGKPENLGKVNEVKFWKMMTSQKDRT